MINPLFILHKQYTTSNPYLQRNKYDLLIFEYGIVLVINPLGSASTKIPNFYHSKPGGITRIPPHN